MTFYWNSPSEFENGHDMSKVTPLIGGVVLLKGERYDHGEILKTTVLLFSRQDLHKLRMTISTQLQIV